jgi:hypothetical protein
MVTVVVQIGNSDDKLSQAQWSKFTSWVRNTLNAYSKQIHFDGGSRFDAVWQNACFVCEVKEEDRSQLMDELKYVREHFKQDSVAVTIGPTEFV